MKLKFEKWVSDQNQEEVHFFVDNDQNEYVFGYNPKYFSQEWIDALQKALCESL